MTAVLIAGAALLVSLFGLGVSAVLLATVAIMLKMDAVRQGDHREVSQILKAHVDEVVGVVGALARGESPRVEKMPSSNALGPETMKVIRELTEPGTALRTDLITTAMDMKRDGRSDEKIAEALDRGSEYNPFA